MRNEQKPSSSQLILEHLEDLWRGLNEPSPVILRRIVEFIATLEEPHRSASFKIIAEHFISHMGLHILDLMTTFQQKAEEENISLANQQETLNHVLQEAPVIFEELIKRISLQSLDDMAALSNISVELQALSSSETAEDAQSWLYELPSMFYRLLAQEKLISKEPMSGTAFTARPVTFKMTIVTEKTVAELQNPVSLKTDNIIYWPQAS
ncbi:MAG TPA: hypothetical protein VEV19_14540 [Ktedonobacteraceae bacterium]|nr:hypothetical protein [Ktedonobacteraceae bacterium]